jgi:DNA-binding transcriptional LysR family regulator
MRFDWDDLRHFLAVARTGQLSAAARRLRSNHVTVSRRIDRLEQALAMRLFERSPRGYTLTILGERLVGHAETMEREVESFGETSLGSGDWARGVARLSTPEGFGAFFLAERLPEFARNHPSLLVEFVTLQQIVSLSRREADLSVTLSAPTAGSYSSEHIARYRLFLYASRAYLAAHGPIREKAEAKGHPLIGYVEDMIFTPGLDYLSEILPGMRAGYQSSSIQAQLQAALAGFGLCILPHFIACRYLDLVPIRPDAIHLERDYWMSFHEDLAGAPRIRILADFIRRQAERFRFEFGGDALVGTGDPDGLDRK